MPFIYNDGDTFHFRNHSYFVPGAYQFSPHVPQNSQIHFSPNSPHPSLIPKNTKNLFDIEFETLPSPPVSNRIFRSTKNYEKLQKIANSARKRDITPSFWRKTVKNRQKPKNNDFVGFTATTRKPYILSKPNNRRERKAGIWNSGLPALFVSIFNMEL